MNDLIVTPTLGVFFVIFLGFVLFRLNAFDEELINKMTKLLIRFFMPLFIFSNITKLDQDIALSELFLVAFTGYTNYFPALILLTLISYFVHHKMDLSKVKRRTFVFSVALQNYGYIPIPLVIALFPDEPKVLVYLLIHNGFLELAIWTVGIAFLKGSLTSKSFKNIINPPFVSIMIALAVFFLEVPIPKFVHFSTELIGQIAIPLALLIVGSTFAGFFKESSSIKKSSLLKKIKRQSFF